MKNYLTLIILIITSSSYCVAQSNKDVLLDRDHEQVIERLKFMNYLNEAAMKLKWDIKKAEDTLQIPFYKYYLDTIVKQNPIVNSNISSYLDYNINEIPPSVGDFTVRVYNRNALNLYRIIERYGFPSSKRLERYDSFNLPTIRMAAFILMASEEWKEILKPLIKRQYEVGNLTKHEYWFCNLAFEKRFIWGQDVDEHLKYLENKKDTLKSTE